MSPPDSASPETLRGRVAVVFRSTTNWSAGRLRTAGGDLVPFAGALVVQQHDPVILRGAWEVHPKFGRQFKVSSFSLDQQLDAAGLAHYLAHHPDIKGIGPVRAERIAEAFGADFDRVIDEHPEQVAAAARLSPETVQALRTEWLRTRALNASRTWLASFGLTHHQMMTLTDRFGDGVVAILRTDPYLIIREIPGFGFKRVDLVARKMGVAKEHPGRIRAGVIHCVNERLDDGDCWVDYADLIEQANDLLVMDVGDSRDRIERALEEAIDAGNLKCVSLGGRFLIADPMIHKMECDLAAFFSAGAEPNPHFTGIDDVPGLIDSLSPGLNAAQRRAVQAAAAHRMVLVSGGAGSGKTFTIAAIDRLYREHHLRVVLAAPTGKAAKRLEQVVGRNACTIHRLLGFNGRSFGSGDDELLEADVVIVDEVSMVDVPLGWHLLRALRPQTMIVLVGDHNQLPPVGPGNLLRDLIERQPIPTVILDEIVRQAGVLKEYSMAVLAGEVRQTAPPGPDKRVPWIVMEGLREPEEAQRYIVRLFEETLLERFGQSLLTDVQLLTPTRKGPLGTETLNALLQTALQKRLFGVDVPPPRPGRRVPLLVGDRVIQTRNNYDLGAMNGAVGFVTEVERESGKVHVAFDDGEIVYEPAMTGQLQLAYALTIHKYQGSEVPCAVVVVHKAHAFQLIWPYSDFLLHDNQGEIRMAQRPVANPAAVEEQILELRGAAVAGGISDEAVQMVRSLPGIELIKLLAHVLPEEQADAFKQS